jgi:hypothetical protein
MLRVAECSSSGFLKTEASCHFRGALAGQRNFVDVGRGCFDWQPQQFDQLTAARRSGSEQDSCVDAVIWMCYHRFSLLLTGLLQSWTRGFNRMCQSPAKPATPAAHHRTAAGMGKPQLQTQLCKTSVTELIFDRTAENQKSVLRIQRQL